MAPTYTLHSFSDRGFGEAIRYMFAYRAQPYEDNRIARADWPALRDTTPCGQLPTLDIGEQDGRPVRQLAQTLAICRYLGRALSLTGADDWENARLDMIGEFISDIVHVNVRAVAFEPNDARKETLKQEALADSIPKKVEVIVKLLGLPGGNRFSLGDHIGWVDLYACAMLELCDSLLGRDRVITMNRDLNDYIVRIRNLPGVREHIQQRPDSDH